MLRNLLVKNFKRLFSFFLSFFIICLVINSNVFALTIGGFDVSRGGYFSIVNSNVYSDFRDAIKNNFDNVSLIDSSDLSNSFLNQLDILIISVASGTTNAIKPLSIEEQENMLRYIQLGGNALLFGDNNTFNSSSTVANKSLLDPFKIMITGTFSGHSTASVIDQREHAIINGPFGAITSITLAWPGWFIDLGPYAISLATSNINKKSVLAVIDSNKISKNSGKVIIFSDTGGYKSLYTLNNNLLLNCISFLSTTNNNGCEIYDTDIDGVPDQWDRCPNTPEGLYTNKYGCSFETDSSEVSGNLIIKKLSKFNGTAMLIQSGELHQKVQIDSNGHYEFNKINNEKPFSLLIRKTQDEKQ